MLVAVAVVHLVMDQLHLDRIQREQLVLVVQELAVMVDTDHILLTMMQQVHHQIQVLVVVALVVISVVVAVQVALAVQESSFSSIIIYPQQTFYTHSQTQDHF
jgi:hypothetical protein